MSVDLFCYASNLPGKVNETLKLVKSQHPELFASKFLIYDAKTANITHKEIALEYQFDAHSFFIVSLNDKESSNLVIPVAHKLKEALGNHNLIILHTNETLI